MEHGSAGGPLDGNRMRTQILSAPLLLEDDLLAHSTWDRIWRHDHVQSPARRLHAAILAHAIHDLWNTRCRCAALAARPSRGHPPHPCAPCEARDWVIGAPALVSFADVCHALSLDTEWARVTLLASCGNGRRRVWQSYAKGYRRLTCFAEGGASHGGNNSEDDS